MKQKLLSRKEVKVSSYIRLLNWIADLVAVIIFFFFILVFANLLTLVGIYGPAEWFDSYNDDDFDYVFVILYYLYYFVMEATTQRTIGKYITGTMVVNGEGEKPAYSSLLGRTLIRLLSLEVLSFLGGNRGWHDSASNTYVVKTKKWKELVALQESFKEIGQPQYESNALKQEY